MHAEHGKLCKEQVQHVEKFLVDSVETHAEWERTHAESHAMLHIKLGRWNRMHDERVNKLQAEKDARGEEVQRWMVESQERMEAVKNEHVALSG